MTVHSSEALFLYIQDSFGINGYLNVHAGRILRVSSVSCVRQVFFFVLFVV